ncbi:protein-lysine 6-oxidase [Streptomyces sp. NRRL WC-3618]|uniref:lysyl oxidase family protein n=1 Tax=Streptomyces sp. NRRL WC-3618 TaxID=1519490 RepID=UPI0006AF699E|nr:lysyl oxidase family protein [Streptomyces sp. NRRL WC-3618]KOV76826.1 protein-lysine 6-oxidase [Streptomyces sp. NRRL WC-3618]
MTTQQHSSPSSPSSASSKTDSERERGKKRLKHSALAAGAALAVVVSVAAAAPGAASGAAPTKPKLRLVAATDSVTTQLYEGDPGVYVDLGTYVSVDDVPLEFKVTRKSYNDPVVAEQIIRKGGKAEVKKLPAGMVKDFAGLPGFLNVSFRNAAGQEVAKNSGTFCPNNASGRIRPDGPSTSHFPESCSGNPFTLGGVWGIEKGWASNASSIDYSKPVILPAGEYTAKVSVGKKYRDLFGIPNDQPVIKMTVLPPSPDGEGGGGSGGVGLSARSSAHHGGGHGAQHSSMPMPMSHHHGSRGADMPTMPAFPNAFVDRGMAHHLGDGPGQTDGSRVAPALKAAAHRPTGRAGVPANVPKPDLRSLPAWDIAVTDGEDGDVAGKDYLAFSANVWNAGPAPLVVDGFRQRGKDLMDAYQYFYDAHGKQVGYAPTGTMEWDPRIGHEHWHFTDFASYRLLSADKTKEVRSGKEAFCLANTDAIDYTVKNANWHPYNTDLSTACGEKTALSVREVLDVGSGDTYTQYRPGQSFDITGLPNGTYYIQVIANPEKRLQESNLNNNVALRKVILGGTDGARTVKVPAHGLIDVN